MAALTSTAQCTATGSWPGPWQCSQGQSWPTTSQQVKRKYLKYFISRKPFVVFDEQFTEEKITKEVEYFQKEPSYERTYGWAWLLKLQEELERSESEAGPAWAEVLRPLTQEIVSLWTEFQPKLVYPLRVGQHTNTAFGLSLAIDYARTIGDTSLEDLIKHNSSVFFLVDK